MDGQGLIRAIGRRLRRLREDAGLSLSAVARDAGVSRRYLTEAEAGRANPSILVLARLASSLGTPLGALVDLPLRARPSERVALVGLRGAGKSTVGKALALALEVPFVELDERVERLAGLSLAEIFDLHGTAAYRRFEAEALEEVLAEGERVVLATGGSLVTSGDTYARLLETCRSVWLRATPEQHYARVLAQGDHRPMANRPRAMDELEVLLRERDALYRRAELEVDTSERSSEEVVTTVVAALELS
jgi:XRE family aerobic/anaerobic benzoate catabolism transcriptional regulator